MKPTVIPLKSHKLIKNQLLEEIGNCKNFYIKNQYNSFTTDFRSDDDKIYFRTFWDHNKNVIEHIVTEIIGNKEKWIIDGFWFQQYKNEESHNWHYHPKSFWTFVYYVELPEDALPVEVIEPFTQNQYIVEAKEGDLVFMPSQYLHRSPPNVSKDQKTIISFNMNYC
jgi:hypothetical protein